MNGARAIRLLGDRLPEITDLLTTRPDLIAAFPLADSIAAGVRMNA